MDVVYIAWGKPFETLTSESTAGNLTTWRYQGTSYREYRHWGETVQGAGYGYPTLQLKSDYVPIDYIRAQVVFEEGVVKSWQNIDQAKQ